MWGAVYLHTAEHRPDECRKETQIRSCFWYVGSGIRGEMKSWDRCVLYIVHGTVHLLSIRTHACASAFYADIVADFMCTVLVQQTQLKRYLISHSCWSWGNSAQNRCEHCFWATSQVQWMCCVMLERFLIVSTNCNSVLQSVILCMFSTAIWFHQQCQHSWTAVDCIFISVMPHSCSSWKWRFVGWPRCWNWIVFQSTDQRIWVSEEDECCGRI